MYITVKTLRRELKKFHPKALVYLDLGGLDNHVPFHHLEKRLVKNRLLKGFEKGIVLLKVKDEK